MTALTEPKVAPAPAGTAYDADLYTWSQEQGARLRADALDGLDRENLAEEIDSLGRSQFDALVGAWRIVLLHMLTFDHQPSQRTRSWAISIAAHRANALYVLKDGPALKSRMAEAIDRVYRGARLEAAQETRWPLKCFPEFCPYTCDDIKTRVFAIDDDGTA